MIIKNNVSLADKNWFETGGCAKHYAEPRSIEDLKEVSVYARSYNIPVCVLGSGANVLINDAGIDGLVIRSKINDIFFTTCPDNKDVAFVHAGSGILIEELISYCFDNGIIGLEEFAGIPSTVGGAVFINLHYFNFLISDFFVSGVVYDTHKNEIFTAPKEWFNFGYDQSMLHDKKYMLVSALFKLKKVTEYDIAFARGRAHEIIRHRTQRYPYKGTCGSFFRNLHDDETSLMINGKKMIFSAYYLDQVGVKGSLKIGNASVSHKHANMIVNNGGATSVDIIHIAREMQRLVYEKYNVMLKPECELLGFKEYPLLF